MFHSIPFSNQFRAMAICAFFQCVNFRAGQFLSKFRRKYINAVLIVAHSLFPHNLCTNFRARINFVAQMRENKYALRLVQIRYLKSIPYFRSKSYFVL